MASPTGSAPLDRRVERGQVGPTQRRGEAEHRRAVVLQARGAEIRRVVARGVVLVARRALDEGRS